MTKGVHDMSATRTTARNGAAPAVVAAAQFVVIMDTSIIAAALPEIQASLGFSPESLS